MEHDGTWLWSSREWMGLELGPTGLDEWNAAFDGWNKARELVARIDGWTATEERPPTH